MPFVACGEQYRALLLIEYHQGCMSQTKHVRILVSGYERATEVQAEYSYLSIGEAIRHVFREAEYIA